MAKIFIIEDDPALQSVYFELLSYSGHDIQGIASNGLEAIQMFKSFSPKPDIILMDHRMPIKNGLETTKEILKLDINSRIIFVSADNSVEKHALKIGAKDFLKKPFPFEDLLKGIVNLLPKK